MLLGEQNENGYRVAHLVSDTTLQAGRSMESVENFCRPNRSGRTVTLKSTQPVTEMSTWDLSWGGRSFAGIAVSNPTRGMDVCL